MPLVSITGRTGPFRFFALHNPYPTPAYARPLQPASLPSGKHQCAHRRSTRTAQFTRARIEGCPSCQHIVHQQHVAPSDPRLAIRFQGECPPHVRAPAFPSQTGLGAAPPRPAKHLQHFHTRAPRKFMRQHLRLVVPATCPPPPVRRHRDQDVHRWIPQSHVAQPLLQPLPEKAPQVQPPAVLETVDQFAHGTPKTLYRHRSPERRPQTQTLTAPLGRGLLSPKQARATPAHPWSHIRQGPHPSLALNAENSGVPRLV